MQKTGCVRRTAMVVVRGLRSVARATLAQESLGGLCYRPFAATPSLAAGESESDVDVDARPRQTGPISGYKYEVAQQYQEPEMSARDHALYCCLRMKKKGDTSPATTRFNTSLLAEEGLELACLLGRRSTRGRGEATHATKEAALSSRLVHRIVARIDSTPV